MKGEKLMEELQNKNDSNYTFDSFCKTIEGKEMTIGQKEKFGTFGGAFDDAWCFESESISNEDLFIRHLIEYEIKPKEIFDLAWYLLDYDGNDWTTTLHIMIVEIIRILKKYSNLPNTFLE